jgi:transposase
MTTFLDDFDEDGPAILHLTDGAAPAVSALDYAHRGDGLDEFGTYAELTDAEWVRLEPLLPPQKPKTGRPGLPHRALINAILWVQHTGRPWRCLPRRYGSWSTAASRYHRWRKAGIWDRVALELSACRSVPDGGIERAPDQNSSNAI